MRICMFKRAVVVAAALTCAPSLAAAEEACPDFGFDSAYLNAFFCDRLQEIIEAEPNVPTRNLDMPGDDAQRYIDDLPLVSEAFRSDPRRTLDLIDRIRSAGGESGQ